MTLDIKEIDGKPVAKTGRIPGITDNTKLVKLNKIDIIYTYLYNLHIAILEGENNETTYGHILHMFDYSI